MADFAVLQYLRNPPTYKNGSKIVANVPDGPSWEIATYDPADPHFVTTQYVVNPTTDHNRYNTKVKVSKGGRYPRSPCRHFVII